LPTAYGSTNAASLSNILSTARNEMVNLICCEFRDG